MANTSNTPTPDDPNFTQNGDGIFAGPNGQITSTDYSSWTWQELEAAILGGSEQVGSGATTEANGIADPQTLWTNGNGYDLIYQTLEMAYQSLQDQVNALASGSGAPWQGAAAQAFLAGITQFVNDIKATADVLGGGSAGLTNVPQQLVTAGNQLAIAQATVSAIDTWYANQAARYVGTMSNGLVPISQLPGWPEQMAHDMYVYAMQPLVGQYSLTIESIQMPPLPTATVPNANVSAPDPNVPVPDPNVPAVDDAANLPGDGSTPTPAPFPGDGTAGPNADDLAATPAPAPFPGDGAAGPNADDLAATPPLGGLTSNPGGDGTTPAPTPFPGDGTAVPNADDLAATPPLAGLTNPDGAVGDGTTPAPAPFPGDGTAVPNADDLAATPPLAGLNPSDLAATPPLAALTSNPSGAPITGADSEPFLPFAPSGGGAGNVMDAAGPTDASGLLSPSAEPFTPAAGDLAADGVPAAGTPAGGGALLGSDGNPITSDSGADSMPFLPFAPSGGGAGNVMDAAGPTDASGLLSPSAEPFTPAAGDLAADGIPAAGTPAGDASLFNLDGIPITPATDTAADSQWSVGNAPAPGALLGTAFAAQSGTTETDASTAHGTGEEGEAPALARPGARDDAGAGDSRGGQGTSNLAAEPPPDRVALVSVPDTPDDISAWDISTDAASLLLLSGLGRGRVEEEEAEPASRFSTEEAAWLDPVPGGPDEPPDDAGLVTWRRLPAGEVQAPVELRSSPAAADDEEVADATSMLRAAENEEEDENETSHGVADLLVQDAALWGAWTDDPGVL